MRSIPVEWTLFGEGPWNYSTNADFIYQFWVNGTERAKPYESIFTIGMRGDGDRECHLLKEELTQSAFLFCSSIVGEYQHRPA